METLESKVSLFEQQILAEAQGKRSEIIHVAEAECEQKIAAKKKKIQEAADSILIEAEKKAGQQSNRLVSKAQLEKNKMLLQKREELIDRLMLGLEEQVGLYIDTKSYQEQLKRRLLSVLQEIKESSIEILLLQKDAAVYEKYKEEFEEAYKGNVMIESLSKEYLGGFVIQNEQRTMYVDETLMQKLKEARPHIAHALIIKMA